jgi:polyisoprenoid-binding protein YceI
MKRYKIDPDRSRFTVQAFAAGLLSAFAHSPTFAVRKYTGEVLLGDAVETLEVELTVDPTSLDLQDRVSASDRREIESRMWGEVLETSRYPEIKYRGRVNRANPIGQGRYQLLIGGDLSLHGGIRNQQFDAELIVFGDGLRLGGGCTLRISEFGIKPVAALGGTIKLKDEVKLAFDLAAIPEQT